MAAGPGRRRAPGGGLAVDLGPVRRILDDAAQVYVAVGTASGPHVTPELFTVSGDRLVCVSAASTLKVNRLRNDTAAGVAARSAAGLLTAVARVDVIDPAHPTTVLRSPMSAASSPIDVARFVRGNAVELTGAVVDALSGRLGLPPKRRVVLGFAFVAAAVISPDGQTWAEGWSSLGDAPSADGTSASTVDDELQIEDLPTALRDLVEPSEVVLGWCRGDGTPLALPARWDEGSVTVPRGLFDAAGAADASAASVTFDEWTGFGPSGKQGVMLRGHGRAAAAEGEVRVDLEIDRATHWDGIDTSTTHADRGS